MICVGTCIHVYMYNVYVLRDECLVNIVAGGGNGGREGEMAFKIQT